MKNNAIRSLKSAGILVLLSLTIVAKAADWNVPILNYAPTNYRAGMQNWNLCQQENGWMYAANNYGMLEYDGDNWFLYGVNNSTTVRSVHSYNGKIYVGATNEFGCFFPNSSGELMYRNLSDSITAITGEFGEVWNITHVNDVLYFQTQHHIFRLLADGEVSVIHSEARIYCCVEQDGALFVATSNGVAILSGSKLVTLLSSVVLQGAEIRSLVALDNDRILIGTDFKGLFVLEDNTIRPYATIADDFIKENQLYTCAVCGDKIAIGTVLRGLVLIKKEGTACRFISKKEGLQNNTILSLVFDKDGNLWAGLDQGIDCILFSSPVRMLSDGETTYGAGYASAIYGGNLYLGTNQGLYCVRNFNAYSSGKCSEAAIELVEGSLGQVWSLAEVDGKLLCCHNRGLFRVEKSKLIPLCEDEGFWRIRQLDTTRWVAGTYKGFYLIEDGKVRRLEGVDETTLHFEVDALGTIWFCSPRGLMRMTVTDDGKGLSMEKAIDDAIPNNYVNIFRYGEQVLVSSADFAFLVNEDGSTDVQWGATHPNATHCTMCYLDNAGGTWYCKDDAIYYKDDAGEVTLMREPFYVPGFANLLDVGDGRVIIGGFGGFYALDRKVVRRQSPDYRLYIRKVESMTDNDSVLYAEEYGVATRKKIQLPAKEHSLRFTLATTFAHGHETLYRTRMEPMEAEFGPWADFHIREYRSLPPGNYTLHVEALLEDQVLCTEIPICIAVPWYHRWWAYCLYGLICILLLAAILCDVLVHARRKQREFEREKVEELRESKMKILELENEKNQMEIHSKSQELSNLLLNRISRNELATDMLSELKRVTDDLQIGKTALAAKRVRVMSDKLARDTGSEIDWKRFEENFDVVNASFLTRLGKEYPWMVKNEKRLCVYIKMGLLTKEIAPLMGISARGIEMMRYRLRQKMELEAQSNLKEHLETLAKEAESNA